MKFKLFILALIFLVSCNPKFSQDAVDKTKVTWQATDDLYNKIIQSPNKNYIAYVDDYMLISDEIQDIVTLNESRKNAKTSRKIIGDIRDRFATYKNEHSGTGTLNVSEARVFKNGMDVLYKILSNTENNLNK